MRLSATSAAAPAPAMAPAFRAATAREQRELRSRGNAKVAITPRWGRVVLGLIMAGIGIGLLAGYLPGVAPLSEQVAAKLAAEAGTTIAKINGARMANELYIAASIAAGALLGFGLLIAAFGAVFRSEVETDCRSCERTVFALRGSFGLRCPACKNYAKVNWLSVAFTTTFWLTSVSMVVVLVVLIAT